MARPKRAELTTQDWPKIRIQTRKDGKASYQVDSVIPLGEEGRRRKRFKDRPSAESYAAALRAEFANHAGSGFALSDTQRADARAAFAFLDDSGLGASTTLLEAVRFYALHARPGKGNITYAALVVSYLANRRKAGLRPASMAGLTRRLDTFGRFLGEPKTPDIKTPSRDIKTITRATVEAWLDSRPITATTRRNDLRVLSGLFEYAMRPNSYAGRRTRRTAAVNGWLAANPLADMMIPETHHEPATLSNEQAAGILRAAYDTRHRHPDGSFYGEDHNALLPYWTLALFAGLRPSELQRLDWRDIRLDRAEPVVHIRRDATKTKAGVRLVPLCEAAVAWLRLAPLPHAGPIIGSPSNFAVRLRRVTRAAGFDRYPVDAARHTFATNRMALTADAARVASELGHANATGVLFTHYRALAEPETARAFFRLGPDSVLDRDGKIIPIRQATTTPAKQQRTRRTAAR